MLELVQDPYEVPDWANMRLTSVGPGTDANQLSNSANCCASVEITGTVLGLNYARQPRNAARRHSMVSTSRCERLSKRRKRRNGEARQVKGRSPHHGEAGLAVSDLGLSVLGKARHGRRVGRARAVAEHLLRRAGHRVARVGVLRWRQHGQTSERIQEHAQCMQACIRSAVYNEPCRPSWD